MERDRRSNKVERLEVVGAGRRRRWSEDEPAVVSFYSPARGGDYPEQRLAGYAGLMQADAYAGYVAS